MGRGLIGLFTLTLALGATGAVGQTVLTSLRTLAATPDRFVNRAVTVTGRFRGRAVQYGAAAALHPPNRSRWDFLLNEDDAAVWVSGIRPAGWDFDLNPQSASDARTGPWLEVTGTVRMARPGRCEPESGCELWIEASDLRPARAPSAGGLQLPIRPAVQTPIVVFNDPLNGEARVTPGTGVRLQFSRSMLPETFSERIRIGYTSIRGTDAPPIPRFSAVYADATRSLTITFATPLAAHQSVSVELLQGILAANGRVLEPWAFTFTTGE